MDDKLKLLNEEPTWREKWLPWTLNEWAALIVFFMAVCFLGSLLVAALKMLWTYILA